MNCILTLIRLGGPWPGRGLCLCAALLAGGSALGVWDAGCGGLCHPLLAWQAAPPAKPAEEEEPPAGKPASPPAVKPPAAEEEEPAPKAAPKPTPAPQDEPSAVEPAGAPLMGPVDANTDQVLEELKETLSDRVVYRNKGNQVAMDAKLLEDYLLPPFADEKVYEFDRYSRNEGSLLKQKVPGADLQSIDFFEDRLRRQALERLGQSGSQLPEPGRPVDLGDIKKIRRAKDAERILMVALAEHDSAVQRGLRSGAVWRERVRKPLAIALFNIHLSQIDLLISQRRAVQAEADCDRLLSSLAPGDDRIRKEVQRRFESVLISRAEQAFAEGDHEAARDLMDQFASRFQDAASKASGQLRARMTAAAQKLLEEARRSKADDPNLARQIAERAAQIWPQLPQLDEFRRDLGRDYQVLHCAYTEMPAELQPLAGRMPIERHAAALLFDSLVSWVDDPETGPHYEPQLCDGLPEPLPRGRRFYLPTAKWSDSSDDEPHFCTVGDLRTTIDLKKHKEVPGYSAAWGQLVADAVPEGSNQFVAAFQLQVDYWQPLALADFWILPKASFPGVKPRDEWDAFNRSPVGTGPYRLAATGVDGVTFKANPLYRRAAGAQIREITFQRLDSQDATRQFEEGKVQLVYGLRGEHVTQLENKGIQVQKLRTPSIWFLAPNHRRLNLQNEHVRLAIAHAIDRASILNTVFRAGARKNDHAELHTPYPASSWACDASLKYNQQFARAMSDEVFKKSPAVAALQLIFPDGDPDVAAACKQIETDVETHTGLQMDIKAMPPAELREHVLNGDHTFDLAYWRHDYADETYWLWPLIDPEASGAYQSNFMGYKPDANVRRAFDDVRRHKHFPEVRALTHTVCKELHRKAALIPLWQLDTYVVVSPKVKGVKLDARRLYANICDWSVQSAD